VKKSLCLFGLLILASGSLAVAEVTSVIQQTGGGGGVKDLARAHPIFDEGPGPVPLPAPGDPVRAGYSAVTGPVGSAPDSGGTLSQNGLTLAPRGSAGMSPKQKADRQIQLVIRKLG